MSGLNHTLFCCPACKVNRAGHWVVNMQLALMLRFGGGDLGLSSTAQNIIYHVDALWPFGILGEWSMNILSVLKTPAVKLTFKLCFNKEAEPNISYFHCKDFSTLTH